MRRLLLLLALALPLSAQYFPPGVPPGMTVDASGNVRFLGNLSVGNTVSALGMGYPAVTVTPSSATGSFLWSYCIAGTDANSNSRISCGYTSSNTGTLSVGGYNTIAVGPWPGPPYLAPVGACNVYRMQGNATVTPASYGVIGTIANCLAGGSFNDTGQAGDSATPGADTSGALNSAVLTVPSGQHSNGSASLPIDTTLSGNFQSHSWGNVLLMGNLDHRYTYSGPAIQSPQGGIIGPSFHTIASPSSSNDNHYLSYVGIHGSVYSNSAMTLGNLVGGHFSSLRGPNGSTNPIFGAMGDAQMGDSGVSGGDGAIGGMFTAYPYNTTSASAAWDPTAISGFTGVLGRTIVNNSYALSTNYGVGIAGYTAVDTPVVNAWGGWFGTSSLSHSMSLASNNYGIVIADIAGAQNTNMAIRTGAGTVQFGGNLVSAGVVGNLSVAPIGTPSAVAVSSDCNSNSYGCTNADTKTYSYVVVACYNTACSLHSGASAVGTTTHGNDNLATSGKANVITWGPVEGAVGGYKIYRTIAGGTTTTSTGLIGSVTQDTTLRYIGGSYGPSTPSFLDAGSAGDSASPPAVNNTGVIQSAGAVYAALGTPTAASVLYCTNCTVLACSSAGTGAWAFYNPGSGAWSCPF